MHIRWTIVEIQVRLGGWNIIIPNFAGNMLEAVFVIDKFVCTITQERALGGTLPAHQNSAQERNGIESNWRDHNHLPENKTNPLSLIWIEDRNKTGKTDTNTTKLLVRIEVLEVMEAVTIEI